MNHLRTRHGPRHGFQVLTALLQTEVNVTQVRASVRLAHLGLSQREGCREVKVSPFGRRDTPVSDVSKGGGNSSTMKDP